MSPKLEKLVSSESQVTFDLVVANHILFNEGVLDAFGHVSARHPCEPSRFLLARSMAPALVQTEDIMQFDLDGQPLGDDSRTPYLERFIHSAIYRARQDVMAIVHSHSPSVIPFGVTKTKLRPICHMGGFLGAGAPIFEIRHSAGCGSDMLIRNSELGDALAETLGSESVVLMRGHGSTAVGESVKQAVFRAVYAEKSAQLLASSLRLGDVEYLTPEEAAATSKANDGQVERPWQLWEMAAQAARVKA
ncbi:class II aldolase/adducin family protein [Pseudomonas guariconensis]|uniref:class II aldolase/adducin family protein n=1 Tax=Pseudomonas guariconensis TaxID=1288410 RepID=UPI0018AAD745|nr:class II aldolase/adducin family protein [Pseudomonas guariconensis]MBF8721778.1 class II aldolase/adducin family protein [Pseudomonas guariconensis]